jgi:hypothetical protein
MPRKRMMALTNRIISYAMIVVCFNLTTFTQIAISQNRNPRPINQPGVIAEDTVLSMRMNDSLSSKTSRVGDKFTATLTAPVYAENKVAIPAGAIVEGKVTQVAPAKRMNKGGSIAVEFEEIILPNGMSTKIDGVLTSDDPEIQKRIDEENRMSGGKSKDTGIFVGQSGAIGAVLGAITGGGKGAVVGGAVGAGVGLASVLFSKGEEASVPAGTTFGIRLKQALPVPDDLDPGTNGTQSSNQQDYSSNSNNGTQTNPSGDPGSRPSTDDPRKVNDSNSTIAKSSPPDEEIDSKNSVPTTEETSNVSSPAPVDLPLSSPEMIRRAQQALRDKGYYEGEVNGEMTPRTHQALKTYQRENRLAETGLLDIDTARNLGITSVKSGSRSIQPTSTQRDTGISSGTTSRPINTERQNNPPSNTSTVASRELIQSAVKVQSLSTNLLIGYQQMIGAKMTDNGVEFENNGQHTESDIDLLFALDSFANSATLFNRMAPSLRSTSAIRNATLSLAREARRTDKVFTTTSSRWTSELTPKWDNIRQEILKLMYMFNIQVTELDS